MPCDILVSTLFSSSRGNCVYIKNGKDEFLIDAGVSARSIECSLNDLGTSLSNIKAVFVTHEHSDHTKGLTVITKHFKTSIYAPKACCDAIDDGVYLTDFLCPIEENSPITFENTVFKGFKTPHDSAASFGYTVEMGSCKFGLATDMGYITKHVAEALTGCDCVVFESNHDVDMLKHGSYPQSIKQRILGNYGHLSNESCAAFLPYLVKNGTSAIALAHLSPENNTPEKAFSVSKAMLEANGISVCNDGMIGDVALSVSPKCKTHIIARLK